MTKKDYELIANVLRKAWYDHLNDKLEGFTINYIIDEFVAEFRKENPDFCRSRFKMVIKGE